MDELHIKLHDTQDSIERMKEEKDQEIMILQAGLDSSLQQLSEVRQVWPKSHSTTVSLFTHSTTGPRNLGPNYDGTNRHTHP